MERAEIEAVLGSRGWLAAYGAAFRAAVFERTHIARISPDQVLFHVGDLAGGIHGIARGAFAVSVATAAATPAVATIVRSGVWFGNGPIVAERRRLLSFRAAEPSVTLHLPLAAIRELSAASIEAASAFADLASVNMQVAVRVVSDLLIPGADRRIAATLRRVTRADEGEGPDDPLGFRLRQAELGEMANASRRSVVRALAAFEAKGWIGISRHRIAVRDAAALERFAHG